MGQESIYDIVIITILIIIIIIIMQGKYINILEKGEMLFFFNN